MSGIDIEHQTEPVVEPVKRVFAINDRDSNKQHLFPSNEVKTSRYTLVTFLPVNLFEQFRRLANFYFLCTVLLDCIPDVSTFPVYTLALPLTFILAVSAVKAGYEDYLRHKEDKSLNNKIHSRLGHNGQIELVRSKNIVVGDILRVSRGEFFPADVILIATSSPDNNCYVNTAELDGETAPKAKRSARLGLPDVSTLAISKIKGTVIASHPIAKFDGFQGRIDVVLDGDHHQIAGLADDQLCLRGSKVDNTQYVYAIVYATGKDSKLMLNRLSTNFKFSTFEKSLNRGVLFSFCLEIVINLIFAIANCYETTFLELERSYLKNLAYEFITSFILFSYLIPLSLYVSMELTKFGQGFIIANDKDMSIVEWEVKKQDDDEVKLEGEDGPQGTATSLDVSLVALPSQSYLDTDQQIPVRKLPRVKTTDINDELGMIEFIMTDKTGTLTKNKMELKACFIDGLEFINSELFPDLVAVEKSKCNGIDNVETLENLIALVWKNDSREDIKKKISECSISQDEQFSSFADFLLNVLCCNDVIVSKNKSDPSKGKYIYQSLSPDEIAFVEALDRNGITLSQSTDTSKEFSVEQLDGTVKLRFQVHGLLGFTADRKRMSIVVEDPTGKFKIFTKGADSKISTFLDENQTNARALSSTNEYLKRFASDGNRTLAFASRSLTAEEFNSWKAMFEEATVSLENRDHKIELAFGFLEKQMTLLGCTSVEDPLQDGVPDAIDKLVHANIVVVVLTGDKQETAVAIGKASRIVQPDAQLHYINTEEVKELEVELSNLISIVSASSQPHHALVINGNALEIAIRDLTDIFLDTLLKMQTVVCSRATPSQKAGMVTLVKTRLNKVCLAIGDGANDVSMIQKANVGVGLTGKEGTQAAQSADFVLHRFRHLPRLLFVHGRYSYIRMCDVVYWSFYKNTLYPIPLFLYGIFSSWSDMPMYDSYVMNLFNVIYTCLPPLVIGWTEKDILEPQLMENPHSYPTFRDNKKFSVWKFIQYLIFGVLQACVCFWFAYGVFWDMEIISSDGKESGLYVFGQWIGTATIVIINFTFLIWTNNWTRVLVGSCVIGVVSYVVSLFIFGWWLSVDASLYGMTNYIFGVPLHYLYLTVCVAVCVIPTYLQMVYDVNKRNSK